MSESATHRVFFVSGLQRNCRKRRQLDAHRSVITVLYQTTTLADKHVCSGDWVRSIAVDNALCPWRARSSLHASDTIPVHFTTELSHLICK